MKLFGFVPIVRICLEMSGFALNCPDLPGFVRICPDVYEIGRIWQDLLDIVQVASGREHHVGVEAAAAVE